MLRYFAICMAMLPLSVDAQVVMEKDGVSVTVKDIDNYIETRLPENNKYQIMARSGFLKETIENIYAIRVLAKKSEANKRLNHELLDWTARMEKNRANMKAQMLDMAQQDLEKTSDWELRAKETYLAENKRFATPELIQASHILIKPIDRSDEEALILAEELRSKAIAGEDFTELAVKYSEDKSVGRNQGNLGEFGRGRMVKEFEEAAFALEKAGDISDVVKSQFGYHIIKLIKKTSASKQSFDEVKDGIIAELQAVQEKAFVERLVTNIRTEAASAIDEEQMDKLIVKYGNQLQEAGLLEKPVSTSEK
ncbi:peptidylprolyl isomerase [Pseudoteredinibacter isoporae]|uniref:peptidylprolyl isomerase n=1 Tax=Pseudoteredinibacter isoporae TaxID=570281 RepID=A0A7X0MWJ6_9GAMM|nr:peptidylprolyl isomerase [Pseudoteredinibacter isoporae]MBB6521014.1 peptidyl-prolyl cis-trans isomerase C [Pseudoteredinibacter isoporae]NHO86579.1 hypothetical protein [Pseudoteredinibacter isoporae]NIB24969.1 hypothetical protein [Pseudoteredinibacter isoporae]